MLTSRGSRPVPCRRSPASGLTLASLLLLLAARPATLPAAAPSDPRLAGHLLDRIAYGPATADLAAIEQLGLSGYLERQLAPESIDEASNTALSAREEALFEYVQPAEEERLIAAGELWHYRKGDAPPPAGWHQIEHDLTGWLLGATGIGYGDEDDRTILDDMEQRDDDPGTPANEAQPGYLTVFLRRAFTVADPEAIEELVLRIDYDDGFVAYLNGAELTRRYVTGAAPGHNQPASDSREAGIPEEIVVSAADLQAGTNVLAIQAHNVARDSSDLSMIPELVARRPLPVPPVRLINGIDALQALLHVRGIYARRQLQAVLAEFWDNHFTTDYDKVADHLDSLRNSDATDAMPLAQARREAAQLEYLEYQFFHDHALGSFGDLLLFSATSPTQLIYLDGVANVKRQPNENYARELLELFAFGVDNRYTQRDIEELARCLTGWTICKVAPDQLQPFPQSALNPPTQCGVQYEDAAILDLGPGWRYLKGRAEPAPAPGTGAPTTRWAQPDFDDSAWTAGSTGIGYGDGDDATVLGDMAGNYLSVYLRREFDVPDPAALHSLILAVDYDDGFVAYLNGTEVGRSENLVDVGDPPPFNAVLLADHEVTDGTDYFSLVPYMPLLQPGRNVLAIQVHNVSLSSSDLSMLPRLIDRTILPGGVDTGDPNGAWTCFFNPTEHDTGAKTLFAGTPQEMRIPAGRDGWEGRRDALDILDRFVGMPSTAEFISIKLIQRFVSDEITLASVKAGTTPAPLRALLDAAIAAWNSTEPPGHVQTVLRAILGAGDPAGPFWSDIAFRTKVKTPIEFVNSSLRALDASTDGTALPDLVADMGMHFFTRDEPDGWSELGLDWMDTASMLERADFAYSLARNLSAADFSWPTLAYLAERQLDTPEEIVGFFIDHLFGGAVPDANRQLFIEFLTTDAAGNPLPLLPAAPDYRQRVEEFVALLLSLPQWQFQ